VYAVQDELCRVVTAADGYVDEDELAWGEGGCVGPTVWMRAMHVAPESCKCVVWHQGMNGWTYWGLWEEV
jgi:hypothetical protein